MKTLSFGILFFIFLFKAETSCTQTKKIIGKWELVKVKAYGRVIDPSRYSSVKDENIKYYQIFEKNGNFKANAPGNTSLTEGTWSYKEKTKELFIKFPNMKTTYTIKFITDNSYYIVFPNETMFFYQKQIE